MSLSFFAEFRSRLMDAFSHCLPRSVHAVQERRSIVTSADMAFVMQRRCWHLLAHASSSCAVLESSSFSVLVLCWSETAALLASRVFCSSVNVVHDVRAKQLLSSRLQVVTLIPLVAVLMMLSHCALASGLVETAEIW
jgi:hypothetical protein